MAGIKLHENIAKGFKVNPAAAGFTLNGHPIDLSRIDNAEAMDSLIKQGAPVVKLPAQKQKEIKPSGE